MRQLINSVIYPGSSIIFTSIINMELMAVVFTMVNKNIKNFRQNAQKIRSSNNETKRKEYFLEQNTYKGN